MLFERSSGVLLHPTSLPGKFGIGDFGKEAFAFIDRLAESGTKLWQVLPLGPTGYGDSPYQSFSAFAGNPYLISPEILIEWKLLNLSDLAGMPSWGERVDYGAIFVWKPQLLQKAYLNFLIRKNNDNHFQDYSNFLEENSSWLDDYALFMAIKNESNGAGWNDWNQGLRDRNPQALSTFRVEFAQRIEEQKFFQYVFFKQWRSLKDYANLKGVKIIGDLPIFVAYDSADVWAARDLFHLEPSGKPTVVSGVPPDYFSETGQLWGNPLFNWEVHAKTEFAWWKRRVRSYLYLFDFFRIDHFRGFAGYWEVPFGEPTAVNGRWVKGPSASFFLSLQMEFDKLPIIAEDLGEITPDVIELREQFGFPGMKILQFAFSGPENPFLPHNYSQNCVAYSGSHDNDTCWGWYKSASMEEKNFYQAYLNRDNADVPGDMVNEIWKSVAVFAIVPMQDLLGLGQEARMNFPGKLGGYWSWRLCDGQFNQEMVQKIKKLNYLYSR